MTAWFLRYPDIIRTEIIITTNVPPEKLIAKTSGRIQAILVKDKDQVLANTPLAIIENSANYEDVFQIKTRNWKNFKNRLQKTFPFHCF